MKKTYIYIALALLGGLLAGWILFGQQRDMDTPVKSGTIDHDHQGHVEDQMWTCSMHPQIMQSEAGDCPICGMDLIPVENNAGGLAPDQIKMTANALALANIQTTVIAEGAGNATDGFLTFSGTIAANKENDAVQSSDYAGRLEQLFVNYPGQQIKKGARLAVIYAPALVAAQQELLTAASLKESQPALYKAVRNKLKNWKISEAQINAIESSGKARENFPIYASVSGTVSSVMAEEGDYLQQGQPIVKVSNLNSVWAEFDVYEDQIPTLKRGQQIEVVPNAYPERTYKAEISFIDPMLSNSTRTVTVRATLNNKQDDLKPGMFITGRVPQIDQNTAAVLSIPASAVLWTGERSLVYVKTNPNNPVFEMRPVRLGRRMGERYEILEGLSQGEEIVTQGTFTVDAAAQLQGKNSMMRQASTTTAEIPTIPLSFSEEFSQQFSKVIPFYLQMKEAFVSSDMMQVSAFAKAFQGAIDKLPKADLKEMEATHLAKLQQYLKEIIESKTLEAQRKAYVLLNENLIPIALNTKAVDTPLFVQKCPMANNNKGAIWLSSEAAIKNPYYGDAMLSCGSVIDTIR